MQKCTLAQVVEAASMFTRAFDEALTKFSDTVRNYFGCDSEAIPGYADFVELSSNARKVTLKGVKVKDADADARREYDRVQRAFHRLASEWYVSEPTRVRVPRELQTAVDALLQKYSKREVSEALKRAKVEK